MSSSDTLFADAQPIPVNKPNATLVSNKLNCAIGEIKWDANKDGVFTIADVRPLTLNIFSLPARYVNSNNSLTKIVDLFEIKGACNGRMAAVFNGCAWLIGYVLLAGLLILIWNLTKLLLQLLLFRGLNLSRSKKLVNNIYWGLYPQWNFAMDFIFPIILCGGVTIISIISLDSFASVSSQQQPRTTSNSPQNQPVVVPSATKPLSGLAPAAQSNIATS